MGTAPPHAEEVRPGRGLAPESFAAKRSSVTLSFALIAIAGVVVALQGVSWGVPIRPVVVATFLAFAPGFAILRLWGLERGWAGIGLSIGISVGLATVVSGAVLYAGKWSPFASLLVLTGLTALASVVSLLRAGRAALKEPVPSDRGDDRGRAAARTAPPEPLVGAAATETVTLPSGRTRRPRAEGREVEAPRTGLGAVPILTLSTGLGLLLCSAANALSRATITTSPVIFWLGVAVIAAPVLFRLTSDRISTVERFVLVCMFGLALYGVKVIRDSPIFTLPGELTHGFTTNQVVATHHLFQANPIIAATKYYPGLEAATSSLTTITGLSSYTCGVILVAVARLTLMGSLFLLFLRISRSSRIAGIATAAYAVNFNFILWEGQYSHESLAIPLMALVLMAVAEREAAPRRALPPWGPPIVLAICAVVVTDHLASYAVAVTLCLLSLVMWRLNRSWKLRNPWRFALFATALALAWAFASIGQFSPVVTGRELVQLGSFAQGAPLPARVIAAAAIVLLAIGFLMGMRRLWPGLRQEPFFVVFALEAIGFFAAVALRVVPSGRVTAGRAGEILFIGLAFVIGYAGVERWRPHGIRVGRIVMSAALVVVLVGGAILDWPWDTVLPPPVEAAAGGGTIVSPTLALGQWAERFGPPGRYAALTADSLLLLDPGQKNASGAADHEVYTILTGTTLTAAQLQFLRSEHVRYVVVDRRQVSADGLRGYFFTTTESGRFPIRSKTKFNRFARIYASGAITIYDLDMKAPAVGAGRRKR